MVKHIFCLFFLFSLYLNLYDDNLPSSISLLTVRGPIMALQVVVCNTLEKVSLKIISSNIHVVLGIMGTLSVQVWV